MELLSCDRYRNNPVDMTSEASVGKFMADKSVLNFDSLTLARMAVAITLKGQSITEERRIYMYSFRSNIYFISKVEGRSFIYLTCKCPCI
jgi:hypothetical protein